MVEIRKEMETPAPVRRQLPTIQRDGMEFHTPIDTLSRSATHLRTPAENTRQGGSRAMARSDFDMRVARNVSEMRLEGSTPLHERFLRLLSSI
jgi:hypothetical protein